MSTAAVLLPGDILPSVSSSSVSKLGPGTLLTSSRGSSSTGQFLVATRAGVLGADKSGKKVWVEGKGKRVSRQPSCFDGQRPRPAWEVAGEGDVELTFPLPPSSSPVSCLQYIPAAQESVIGTVVARHAEGYRVDIGSAQMASLDALAFEGATKRNKPNLKVSIVTSA